MEDYYKVLGVSKTATVEEIKKAYRQLALQWHPDKNPQRQEEATNRFKKIAEAYEILGNPGSRHEYDNAAAQANSNGSRRGRRGNDSPFQPQDYYNTNDDDSSFHQENTFRFQFRNPQDIFRDFFGDETNSPFVNILGGGASNFFEMASSSLLFPRMEFPGAGQHFSRDLSSSSSSNSPAGHFQSFQVSTSTTTSIANGKKVTRVRKCENGVETTEVYENDVLKSRKTRELQEQRGKEKQFIKYRK